PSAPSGGSRRSSPPGSTRAGSGPGRWCAAPTSASPTTHSKRRFCATSSGSETPRLSASGGPRTLRSGVPVNLGVIHMFGKSTPRRARRCAIAIAAVLAVAAVAAPAAEAAVVHATPVPTYQTNGRVNSIVIQNGVIYIGGRFTAVRPAGSSSGSVTRNHAAALSLATGQVLPWDPNVNGTVQSLAVGNGRVYLGGSFSSVGGTSRTRLAAVDAASGAVVSGFNPRPSGAVNSLAVSGNTL